LQIAAAANLAYVTVINVDSVLDRPETTINALIALSQLFGNWNLVFLYIALVAFLWDREGAICIASGGKAGGHNVIRTVIHVILILLTLALGTATAGVLVNARVQYLSNHAITLSSYREQLQTSNNVNYAFSAFSCITSISFFVSALLLHKASCKAGVKDTVMAFLMFYFCFAALIL
jgi:hypothetical protein